MQCVVQSDFQNSSKQVETLLQKIIGPYHAAFITGRNITENVILTQEILHSFKRGRATKMAVKIDMAKAYDKLEWGFIEAVLKNIGFSIEFVKLIMQCSPLLNSYKRWSIRQHQSFEGN